MRGEIGGKTFRIAIADSDEKRRVGLSSISRLPKDGALLMKFNEAKKVPVRMSDMKFPIDVVFMKDGVVQKVVSAKPGDEDITIGEDSDAVLELKAGSGANLKKGDKLSTVGSKNDDGTITIADEGLTPEGDRHLLDDKGNIQKNLKGEERVFSRKHTKSMMELAKSGDFMGLAKAAIKAINKQDTQDDQFSKN